MSYHRRPGPYVPPGLILRLDNPAQVILFNEELAGQISDGYWENSNPWEHYKWVPMRELVTVAAPGERTGLFYTYTDYEGKSTPVRYTAPRKYNFANKNLVEWQGDEMLKHVKSNLLNMEWYTIKSLKKDLKAISDAVNGK
jgi:hypothetical protein